MRAFDTFASYISLNFTGIEKYGTVGGGLATLTLKLLVLAFLVKQVIQLANYGDPTISSYEIYREGTDMTDPINAHEMGVQIYLGF